MHKLHISNAQHVCGASRGFNPYRSSAYKACTADHHSAAPHAAKLSADARMHPRHAPSWPQPGQLQVSSNLALQAQPKYQRPPSCHPVAVPLPPSPTPLTRYCQHMQIYAPKQLNVLIPQKPDHNSCSCGVRHKKTWRNHTKVICDKSEHNPQTPKSAW